MCLRNTMVQQTIFYAVSVKNGCVLRICCGSVFCSDMHRQLTFRQTQFRCGYRPARYFLLIAQLEPNQQQVRLPDSELCTCQMDTGTSAGTCTRCRFGQIGPRARHATQVAAHASARTYHLGRMQGSAADGNRDHAPKCAAVGGNKKIRSALTCAWPTACFNNRQLDHRPISICIL